MFVLFLSLIFASIFCEGSRLINCDDVKEEQAQLCNLAPGYKKGSSPKPIPNYHFQELTLFDILDLDPKDQTITISVKLRTEWNDSRVTLKSGNPENSLKWLLIDKELSKDLFFPKQQIKNVKRLTEAQPYSSNVDDYYWFHVPHDFEYEETFIVTIFCSFDFSSFPFDHQHCDFVFGLSQQTTGSAFLSPTLIKTQDGNQTQFGKAALPFLSVRLPFDIKISGIEPFSVNSSGGFIYSHAGMRIDFTRNKLSQLIGGFYGPTAIFAILSMISYSINPEVVPGRLGLLVTLYLIASNVYNSVKAPEDRGFSYIEVWMTGIQIMILLAIFEYGIALTLMKYYKKPKVNESKMDGTDQNDIKNFINFMDKITLFLASSFFILFVCVYWIVAKS